MRKRQIVQQPVSGPGVNRACALAAGSLGAGLLLFLLAVSLADAALLGNPSSLTPAETRAADPTITNPVITETSEFLHAEGTTLYYGDLMSAPESFWLGGNGEGSDLSVITCTVAFSDGEFSDDSPTAWSCGPYNVGSGDSGDGVITATLYNTTGTTAIQLFAFYEDSVPPTVEVQSPDVTNDLSWQVSWSGIDPEPGSGIATYDIQYRVDTGMWTDWLTATTETAAIFGPAAPVEVQYEHAYSFRVLVTDLTGNTSVYSDIASTKVEYRQLYLPLVLRNFPPIVPNGGFEDGWTGWQHGGELAQSISTADVYEGTYAARLGSPSYACTSGVPVGSAWLEKTISIPDEWVSTLRIYYRIWSEDKLDGDLYDRFQILMNGTRLMADGNQTGIFDCTNPPQSAGWEYFDIDVLAYRGLDITLRLENLSTPDGWYNTWTYVDAIKFLP